MAGNFAPEIKASMQKKQSPPAKKPNPKADPGESPADAARDKKMGIAQGSSQDVAMDARNVPPPMPVHAGSGGGNSPAHAAMATSIAHAILQRGG